MCQLSYSMRYILHSVAIRAAPRYRERHNLLYLAESQMSDSFPPEVYYGRTKEALQHADKTTHAVHNTFLILFFFVFITLL